MITQQSKGKRRGQERGLRLETDTGVVSEEYPVIDKSKSFNIHCYFLHPRHRRST